MRGQEREAECVADRLGQTGKKQRDRQRHAVDPTEGDLDRKMHMTVNIRKVVLVK